eukprot:11711232-Heterocapsa_arctica.AAC.1
MSLDIPARRGQAQRASPFLWRGRNRRPQNATEGRLRWAQLPRGSLLGQIRVRPTHHVRGSGDDLSNYFYVRENLPIGATGARLGASSQASKPNDSDFLRGADVSQVCHEGVLRTYGGLSPEHQLSCGKPVPRWETLQGVYIDDHLIVGIVPKSRVSDND